MLSCLLITTPIVNGQDSLHVTIMGDETAACLRTGLLISLHCTWIDGLLWDPPSCLSSYKARQQHNTHLSLCRLTHMKFSDPPHTASSSSRVGRDCHTPLLFCLSAKGRWFVSLRCRTGSKTQKYIKRKQSNLVNPADLHWNLARFSKRRILWKEDLYVYCISFYRMLVHIVTTSVKF